MTYQQDQFAVEIKDLVFGYDKERPVLKGLNLRVRKGERLGIIGPSGAGKSTLLLHLNGILMGQGEIKIYGTKITKQTLPDIRTKVGLVFQNPDDQLFNPTVEEDVAFGPLNQGLSKEEVFQRIKKALDMMSLEGYERKSSHHLSYGERKRVALATVLSMQPEVVAFDEPFANLDPKMVKQVIDIIQDLPGTVIIVSQRILPMVACCQRLAILDRGKIMAVGKTEEIIADQKLMRSSSLDFGFYRDIFNKIFSS